MTGSWHVITGEYPPQHGGVSDYTRHVARELASQGERVEVWAPNAKGPDPDDLGVRVHRLAGRFDPASLASLGRGIDSAPAPRRILVQYVPHGLGLRGMNVPFCAWLASRRRETVLVMMHEVAYPMGWDQKLRHNVLATVQNFMAKIAVNAADHVFVSVPAWRESLTKLVPNIGDTTWLPVPSNVPTHVLPESVRALRERMGSLEGASLIGHFGTFASIITDLLDRALVTLLERDSHRIVLLVGRGSDAHAASLTRSRPELATRIRATGSLPPDDIATHLAACDVLVQPYPDGVTSRRGSVMAGLGLGRAVVTNDGALTERLWRDTSGLALASRPDPMEIAALAERVLTDAALRDEIGKAGAELYASRFALSHVVETLRATASVLANG